MTTHTPEKTEGKDSRRKNENNYRHRWSLFCPSLPHLPISVRALVYVTDSNALLLYALSVWGVRRGVSLIVTDKIA